MPCLSDAKGFVLKVLVSTLCTLLSKLLGEGGR